jgi:thiol-disulfide isomerase/thioredoxin
VARALILVAVIALIAGLSVWWKRRDGHLFEATGSLKPADLGFSRKPGTSATIVQFTGKGCAPCVPLREKIESIVAEIGDVTYVSIDAGEQLDIADRYDVKRVPTVLIADERLQIRWRASGVPSEQEIRDALLGPSWAGRPHPDPANQPS